MVRAVSDYPSVVTDTEATYPSVSHVIDEAAQTADDAVSYRNGMEYEKARTFALVSIALSLSAYMRTTITGE